MADETKTREQELKEIRDNYIYLYPMTVAAFLIVLGILIGYFLFREGGLVTDDNGYIANVYTNVLSVVVTVFVIDRFNRKRDEQREERELKQQLIRDASSGANEVAKNAIHQIRQRKWLYGKICLLQDTELSFANLCGAALSDAQLKGANLLGANLTGANLICANLSNVNLMDADLDGAYLFDADFSGANLRGAELKGALLDDAKLPDGTRWTPDTNLERFTNPNHPDFWRSDDPQSPAWRGL